MDSDGDTRNRMGGGGGGVRITRKALFNDKVNEQNMSTLKMT